MTASEPLTKQIYWLEMQPEFFRPKRFESAELEIRQVRVACPEYNWFLHQCVGVDYRWGGREGWGPAEWHAYADRPELETWVAYVSGTPAGYFELEKQSDQRSASLVLVSVVHSTGRASARICSAKLYSAAGISVPRESG